MFNNPNFLKALTLTAECTMKTGHEAGFIVAMDPDEKLYVYNVIEGGCANFHGVNVKIIRFKDEKITVRSHKDLFDFHFHPEAKGDIFPSSGDLCICPDGKPYVGIGKITNNGLVFILLIKAINKNTDPWQCDNIDITGLNQQELIQALEPIGYTGIILPFGNVNKGLRLPKSRLLTLKNFTDFIKVPENSQEFGQILGID